MTRVWVLDVDDTLYLERDYVRSGFRAVGAWAAETFSVSGISEIAWRFFLDGRRGTTITDAFDAAGHPLSHAEARTAVAVYREHRPDISLCGDAGEFLDALPDTAPIGIITDGPAVSQRAKIDALGLDARVSVVVVTSEHGPSWHKPSVLGFEHVQSLFNAEAADCAYVADNPLKDFRAPRSLGWATVRIVRPGGLHARAISTPGEVDREVSSFRVLLDEMRAG